MPVVRFLIGSVLLLMQFSSISNAQSSEPASSVVTGRVNTLKEFLSKPPIVEKVHFTEAVNDFLGIQTMDTAPHIFNAFHLWEGAWQPGAYILREVKSVPDFDTIFQPDLLVASTGAQCWFHYGRRSHPEIIQISSDLTNEVCKTAYVYADSLRQALCLGIMHMEPGSAAWEGNRFHARQTEEGFAVAGELDDSNSDSPVVRVTYESKDALSQAVVRYQFDSQTSLFPWRIQCSVTEETNEFLQKEISILSTEFQTQALPATAFNGDRFVVSNQWRISLHSNGTVYAVLRNGKLKDLKPGRVALGETPSAPTHAQLGGLYSFWAGSNLLLLYFAKRSNSTKKQQLTIQQ